MAFESKHWLLNQNSRVQIRVFRCRYVFAVMFSGNWQDGNWQDRAEKSRAEKSGWTGLDCNSSNTIQVTEKSVKNPYVALRGTISNRLKGAKASFKPFERGESQ
ncbi:hypothetical protein AB6D20_027545 (plasmid) [Vibrio splendidus]